MSQQPIDPALANCGIKKNEWIHVAMVGFLIGLLNVFKPVMIDDSAFLQMAEHVTSDPLHPLIFDSVHRGIRELGFAGPMPPVVPFWQALTMKLVGTDALGVKAGFIVWGMVWSMGFWLLSRRLLASNRIAALWVVGGSAFILPWLNLMTDIPAAGLAMMTLAVMLKAWFTGWEGLTKRETPDYRWACAAGVLMGASFLAKLSTLSLIPAALAAGWMTGGLLPAVTACVIGIMMQLGWEVACYMTMGFSSLAYQLKFPANSKVWGPTIVGLIVNFGVMGFGPAVFALWVLTRKHWPVLTAAVAFAAGTWALGRWDITAAYSWCMTVFTLGILGWLICRLASRPHRGDEANVQTRLALGLLGVFLLVELGSTAVVSPFPAVRRVIMACVFFAMLAWRAQDALPEEESKSSDGLGSMGWVAAGVGVAMGFVFYAVDLQYGLAVKSSFARIEKDVPEVMRKGDTWFLGSWGGSYYGPKVGLREYWVNESLAMPGQLIVFFDKGLFVPATLIAMERLQPLDKVEIEAEPGYSTLGAYDGRYPLAHRSDAMVEYTVYRALKPVDIVTPMDEGYLLKVLETPGRVLAPGLVRPFFYVIAKERPQMLEQGVEKVFYSGAKTVSAALKHANPKVRAAVLLTAQTYPEPDRWGTNEVVEALKVLHERDPDTANQAMAGAVLNRVAAARQTNKTN